MQQILHIPSYNEILAEYKDAEDLKNSYEKYGCKGLEIICCGEDERKIITPQMVKGLHMCFYPSWIDFWNQDKDAMNLEFGKPEVWEGFYGGKEPRVLLEQFEKDLAYAQKMGAEYVVFHISDVTIEGVFTHQHTHTDEEVIAASAEVINQLLDGKDYNFTFLMENLWWPGLTMTNPEMTAQLLDFVHYERKGIMLDTGHLMCTNLELKTEEEAWNYVDKMLDIHGELIRYIKGVHLHQSVTGEFTKKALKEVPKLEEDYYKRFTQVYQLLGNIDTHKPTCCLSAKRVINRIKPKYIVHELMASNRQQRETVLKKQSSLFVERT